MPMNIIEYTAITRPRSASGTIVWMSVFDEEIWTIIANPIGRSTSTESHIARESEKTARSAPKAIAARATQPPRPRTSRLEASAIAPVRAPTPAALIRTPYAAGPPESTRSANTGMRTMYGMPVRLRTASMTRSARTGRSRAANAKPCRIRVSMGARSGGWNGATRIASSATMTAAKLTPLMRKHHPSPIVATRMPATAGPVIRAPLKSEELSPMALIRSSRPTISTRNDCRAGMSNALTIPRAAASATMCHSRTTPPSVSAASANASTIEIAWVKTMIRWRSNRSATAPPIGARRKIGTCRAKPTRPSIVARPVSR